MSTPPRPGSVTGASREAQQPVHDARPGNRADRNENGWDQPSINRRPAGPRRDQGQISAGLAGTFILLVLLAGLLLDPGMAIAARIRALDVAQAAARAGADKLDLVQLRTTGLIRLDPEQAHDAAAAFLAEANVTGTVTATTTQVSVTVTATQPTQLLTLVGIDSLPVQATATARPDTGDSP